MIPIQERANLGAPEEFAAWATLALPTHNGDVVIVHPADAKARSEWLWKLGFRHVPDAQTHRLSHPGGPDASFMAASGVDIVPIDTPRSPIETAAVELPDVSQLSLEHRTALFEQLRALGHGEHDTPPPERVGAVVTSAEAGPFTPAAGQVWVRGSKARKVEKVDGDTVKARDVETGRLYSMKTATLRERWALT